MGGRDTGKEGNDNKEKEGKGTGKDNGKDKGGTGKDSKDKEVADGGDLATVCLLLSLSPFFSLSSLYSRLPPFPFPSSNTGPYTFISFPLTCSLS